MTEQEKTALIAEVNYNLQHCFLSSKTKQLMHIALDTLTAPQPEPVAESLDVVAGCYYRKRQVDALLTAPPAPVKFSAAPVVAPCKWVYIRFTDTSKNQRMKCQVAWSDWLNSVIYDEEGAPLLISNSAFEVIRAAGYPVEGE